MRDERRGQSERPAAALFNRRMSNTVRLTYHHLKTGKQAVFCFDPNNPTSIELDFQGDNDLLDETKLVKVPVYGKIAAGHPIQMNTELGEDVYLPKAWLKGADHFALKVQGDECTLKRFSKMGNNAILQAENPKYDPILLNDDQVNILGLAVGVIKVI